MNVSHQKKLEKEKEIVEIMIKLYCKGKHNTRDGLCESCEELLKYTDIRVDKCKLGENKTTCGKCKIHCYKPDMREKIRDVMRYSGPRMVLYHPTMAIRHLIEELRQKNQ